VAGAWRHSTALPRACAVVSARRGRKGEQAAWGARGPLAAGRWRGQAADLVTFLLEGRGREGRTGLREGEAKLGGSLHRLFLNPNFCVTL
jgi:hypothetical protein